MRIHKSFFMLFVFVAFSLLPTGATAAQMIPFKPADVPSLAPILEGKLSAVVNIAARAKSQPQSQRSYQDPFGDPFFNDPFFRRFFEGTPFGGQRQFRSPQRPEQQRPAQSIGSGVIVDAGNGYVLTNHHVIANAEEIFVILQDKRRLEAEIVGSDPDTDVAVLKVTSDNLAEMPIGNSDAMLVGDYVIAIGNPFGLSHTVTSGIVSALGRSGLGIEGYEDFIQTDAPINPGNSGGALMNLHGELIGINTAIYSRSGGSMGIGFAIPVDMAKSVMDQIIEHGEVKRGQIGIMIQDVTPDLAEAFGLDRVTGALVAQVVPDSPAADAGVEDGDIITHVNGTVVNNSSHLRNLVGLLRLGDEATVRLLREGDPVILEIEVGEADDQSGDSAISSADLLQGVRFGDIPENHPLYGQVTGVYVGAVDRRSRASQAGLQPGDIVVSVNQEAVDNVSEITELSYDKDTILLNIRRGSGGLFIVIK